jgi:hypothetical protein
MAATPPSQSNPAGDDRNLVPVNETTAVTFEDKAHLFWKKNSAAVYGFIVVVLLAIAGYFGWEYLQQKKDADVKADYAAATTPEQKKAFAAAHVGHPLEGIAYLTIADDAYKAGKSADAAANYDKAISVMKKGPLVARAQLGRALSKAQAGKSAEAVTELKQIADDKAQSKLVRAEAAYNLTSLAVEAGNATDAQKYVDQLVQIDAQSPWTQRAMALRASMNTPADKPATEEKSATPAPKADTKSDESGALKVNIPGKK